MEAYRSILLEGAGLGQLGGELLQIGATAGILFALAGVMFNAAEEKVMWT